MYLNVKNDIFKNKTKNDYPHTSALKHVRLEIYFYFSFISKYEKTLIYFFILKFVNLSFINKFPLNVIFESLCLFNYQKEILIYLL